MVPVGLACIFGNTFSLRVMQDFYAIGAYPALKNCAAFYLDWLQIDTVSGKWISYPETSPENSLYRF